MQKKHIVIVGGSSGIGLALAKKLAELGAKITIASRSTEKLNIASDQIKLPISTYQLDASSESDVINFFNNIERCEHLICTIKPAHVSNLFIDTATCDHKTAFDAKYWGQYFLTLHAIRSNAVNNSIILTSGIAAAKGYKGFSGTAAINGAIESLVKSLATELAPIRINAISPGFVERLPNDNERYALLENLGSNLPLKRLGTLQEMVEGYLYLMQNSYTTGSVLAIDGGELCT